MKARRDVLVFEIDRLVEAEFVDGVRTFLGAAGDSDDLLRALDLRDLARGGSGRPCRTGDDDDVALLHLPHIGQAEVGRHAVTPRMPIAIPGGTLSGSTCMARSLVSVIT